MLKYYWFIFFNKLMLRIKELFQIKIDIKNRKINYNVWFWIDF